MNNKVFLYPFKNSIWREGHDTKFVSFQKMVDKKNLFVSKWFFFFEKTLFEKIQAIFWKDTTFQKRDGYNVLGKVWTLNPQIRSLILYPIELQALLFFIFVKDFQFHNYLPLVSQPFLIIPSKIDVSIPFPRKGRYNSIWREGHDTKFVFFQKIYL